MADLNHDPIRKRITAAEGWLELGDWRTANDELDELPPEAKASASAIALRVRIYAAAGRFQESLMLAPAVESLPDAEMLLALARCACKAQRIADARRWIERAVEVKPTKEFRKRILDDPGLESVWETER